MAVITLITAVITGVMEHVGNELMLPLENDSADIALLIPVIIYLLVFIIVTILISPLSAVVSARITRRAVTGEAIDFSLMRLSGKELLRGIRVTLVVAWRAILIPMIVAYAVVIAQTVLMYAGMELPEALTYIIMYGSLIAAAVWMICRSMYYPPVYQLMVISPDAKARELADQSKELMKGNRLRLVGMHLSFFGWMLLYSVFQSIGQELLSAPALWVALTVFNFVCLFVRLPLDLYIDTALAAFTKDLRERG